MKIDFLRIKKTVLKKKRIIPVIVCIIAAALLLCIGNGENTSVENISADTDSEYAEKTEERLEKILSSVEGVGKCRVMVVISEGSRSEYLQDSERSGDNLTSTHIIIKSDGNESCVTEQKIMPRICGVAVVCEGAGSVRVKTAVENLVAQTLNIDRTCVTVAKHK